MELKRAGSQPSIKGPEEWFTGAVRIDPLNFPPEPARVSVASVTFEPGARTAWHTILWGRPLSSRRAAAGPNAKVNPLSRFVQVT